VIIHSIVDDVIYIPHLAASCDMHFANLGNTRWPDWTKIIHIDLTL
jgi:hypothetical protein